MIPEILEHQDLVLAAQVYSQLYLAHLIIGQVAVAVVLMPAGVEDMAVSAVEAAAAEKDLLLTVLEEAVH
jgi:hypothetical protein